MLLLGAVARAQDTDVPGATAVEDLAPSLDLAFTEEQAADDTVQSAVNKEAFQLNDEQLPGQPDAGVEEQDGSVEFDSEQANVGEPASVTDSDKDPAGDEPQPPHHWHKHGDKHHGDREHEGKWRRGKHGRGWPFPPRPCPPGAPCPPFPHPPHHHHEHGERPFPCPPGAPCPPFPHPPHHHHEHGERPFPCPPGAPCPPFPCPPGAPCPPFPHPPHHHHHWDGPEHPWHHHDHHDKHHNRHHDKLKHNKEEFWVASWADDMFDDWDDWFEIDDDEGWVAVLVLAGMGALLAGWVVYRRRARLAGAPAGALTQAPQGYAAVPNSPKKAPKDVEYDVEEAAKHVE